LAIRSIRVRVGEQWYTIEVEDLSSSPVRVTVEGETFYVEVEGLPQTRRSPAQPRATRSAASEARTPTFRVSEKVIYSPMPGRVVAINVRPGDAVSAGQEVCVVEAMKMEQSIRSPQNGVVKEIRVQPMDSVRTNDPLIELE
jgi:biotin carboxyl carrier protein